jgi:hypothetical protein
MKFIYTIFLLLTTAIYVLPVREFIKAGCTISVTDMADENEEHNNKEKLKEFIFVSTHVFLPIKACSSYQHSVFSLPAQFHSIETPPPDNNG